MIASVKKTANKIRTKIKTSILKYYNMAYRKIKQNKKKTIIISLSILITFIVVVLVMQSFKGVDVTDQAVIINYTQQKLISGSYTNQITHVGINADLFKVPLRKFLIYFQNQKPQDSEYWMKSFPARSSEGTKLIVSAIVSCQIPSSRIDLQLFLEEYGLNWNIYAAEKAKNSIIQQIAAIKFYELSNSAILQAVNTYFTAIITSLTSYPFTFKLINIKLQYPLQSFSAANTLGIKLLSQKSKKSQLTTKYSNLNSKINYTLLQLIGNRIGELQGEIQTYEMQTYGGDLNWAQGVDTLYTLFNSSDATRKYLWLYFQKVHNATFNNYTLF